MKSQTIILHVGHGKTGSSFLQSCLALNRKKLQEYGISYPFLDSYAKAIAGEVTSGNGGNFLKNIQDIGDTNSKVLFSSESLFHSLIGKDLIAFNDLLGENKFQFQVIIYTRNLFEHLFSRWGQLIKMSQTSDDLNSFLMQAPLGPHPKILDWLHLSKRFDFKLKITNYSRHKSDLANRFFFDLTGVSDFPFELPPFRVVNRSLTYAEINFQRVCNQLNFRSPPLHKTLVKQLPGIGSSQYKCSQNAYDIVKKSHYEIFRSINDHLCASEVLEIEPPEKVVADDRDLRGVLLSAEQLDLITNYFFDRLADR